MLDTHEPPAAGSRLDSWKAIARHLGRDVRTAQRWEKEEGLPVHRHRHRRLASIYAFEHELDAWRAAREPAAAAREVGAEGARHTPAVGWALVVAVAAVAATGVWWLARDSAASARTRRAGAALAGPAAALFEQAEYAWHRGTPAGFATSLELYGRVTALAPDFAPAEGGLALAHAMLGRYGVRAPAEAFPAARATAEHAVALDPSRPEGHLALALVALYWDWDWDTASGAFRRAIRADPSYAPAHHAYAHYLSALGRQDEAIQEGLRARQLEPLSPLVTSDIGWFYIRARRYDQALDACRTARRIDPAFPGARQCVIDALDHLGRGEEALEELRQFADATGLPLDAESLAAGPAEAGRRFDQARLEAAERARASRYVSAYGLASLAARLGRVDQAFRWLDLAAEDHDPGVLLVAVHPNFDALRTDPRYDALLGRIGLKDR